MFLGNINWRHIVGALVTGIILQIAGIINFWIFLALVVMAITIALAQYLPAGRRTATFILVVGIIATIGIPTVHRFVSQQWPQTAKAIKKQNQASDLKGYESLNQPGLIGIAAARKLAEEKEQKLTALALSWFERAAQLLADGKFADAETAEKSGRHNLNLAIEAREDDAQYIKDKLSKVKVPAGWWESVKNFFIGTDFSGTWEWTKKQGFSLRLLILSFVLLMLGTLVLRRLSKSFGGAVVVAGCVGLVWALFLLITPELAPNPAASPMPRVAAHAAAPAQVTKTFDVPAGKTIATGIFMKAGQIARFHQPSPQVYYLKGDRKDIPVCTTDWTDQWRSPGQIGLRGGPQPTTVTVIVGG